MQYRRLFILLAMVAALVGAMALDPVHGTVASALEWAKQVIRHHEALGLLVFVLLSALSAVLFFFSTAVIVPVAIYSWGKPATILLLWVSWMLGAAASYWIGRRPGRKLAKWLVRPKQVAKYEKKITAKANFPLVLLFQTAVPSEIPGYVLGALRYGFGKYLGARALAEVPFAIAAVYLGESFLRRQYLPVIAIAIGGILFSGLALYFLHRRIDR
ncbi:MAG TPA: VTT domain-containing protein [bacterium]|nr:VTT domain-containing protein [bacterium]